MATIVIIVMPLVTEIYELRKFMLERASVEPGSPTKIDPDPPQNSPPPVVIADDQFLSLKLTKSTTNEGQSSAAEIAVHDAHNSQSDML